MKKIIILFPVLLFVFSAKSQLSIYRDNSVDYKGIEEIRNYHLYNKKENPSCHLQVHFFYPVSIDDKKLQTSLQTYFIDCFFGKEYSHLSVDKAAGSYANSYVENYKNDFEQSGLYKQEEEKANNQGDDISEYESFYIREKTMRNTILFNRGDVISHVVNSYEYTGGAHGANSTQGYVYDINSEGKISYDDVFYEDTEEALSELLLKNLMLNNRYPDEEAMISAGFTSAHVPPSDNFVADDKGMTFIYNPYSLGAYVLGTMEVFVPYSELFIYMKPECTLFRWAKKYFSGNRLKYNTSLLNKEFFMYDPNRFPGFTAEIQFTYPNAYFDKAVLSDLQKLFVKNAFGEKYTSYPIANTVDTFYSEMQKEYEDFMLSEKVQHFIKKETENSADTASLSLGKDYVQKNVFHFNQNDLISYEIERSDYTDETHGTESTAGFVVHVPTAKNLAYDDVFISGIEEKLNFILLRNLMKQKSYELPSDLISEGYDPKKILPNNNFYFDTEGIVFIYNPHEIGPYSLGTSKVKIPYREITSYLQPDILSLLRKE
ncbi:MAG: DUF3298 and DUF4163 domain-containing protein [Dysgonamonadaceae bacterium]|jgi:hypothetical protein|nr:DUF3298 and DUF4163 domain-containing protein [Dysgonamonadaceae bacterium]